MAKIKKKGEHGQAANYITRTRAIKKLQLSLADFRRVCILKGIYPREPGNKKKASGNNNANNTFYLTKDIKFLLREPIVQQIREEKIHSKKLNRAFGKQQRTAIKTLLENRPRLSLNHLIRER